jgi:polysaccharide biosynthesis transport protein
MARARAELRDIQAKIQTEVGKIVQALENEAGVARARENALEQSLEQTKTHLAQSNIAEVQLRALERQAEAERTMLETFLKRFEETSARMDMANQQSAVRVLSRAVAPEFPSFPPKKLTLVVVFTLSLLVAIGLVFLLEQFDRGFRSGEQIERLTGVRSLGLIPLLKTSWRRRSDPAGYVLKRPTSQFGEAIRSFYTSILIAIPDPTKAARSILITSCQPGEGKTTLCACVGRMYASSGRKVVIIEADVAGRACTNCFGFGEARTAGVLGGAGARGRCSS